MIDKIDRALTCPSRTLYWQTHLRKRVPNDFPLDFRLVYDSGRREHMCANTSDVFVFNAIKTR